MDVTRAFFRLSFPRTMQERTMTKEFLTGLPEAHGLYDPAFEHDACGIGFIADIKGRRSHDIVRDTALMLTRMEHRGGCGCEANTGDGAGILTALPVEFLAKVAKRDLGIELPPEGRFSAGVVFLPTDEAFRRECRETFERYAAEEGIKILGWRKVPIDPDGAQIGETSRRCMPVIEQVFVTAGSEVADREALERRLFVLRKRASHTLRQGGHPQAELFYVCSLSTKVIVYKGMLTTYQLVPFYPDLADPDYCSHLAMVHSRYSTNTFPSWDRAQPLRFMSHNGEINTLRGNKNWMYARQGVMSSDLFTQAELEKVFPICEPRCSDSGNFDNALELLLMAGRPLPEAVMMMIPEAWQNHESMPEDKRAFYEYHSALQEPWDGPASICFSDGHYIGAVLDRNGLRPSRYYVTKNDRVIMASEVGALEVPADEVVTKGRLQPGKMFLVDFEEGRIIDDEELKHAVAARRDYRGWLERQRITLGELPSVPAASPLEGDDLLHAMQAFGYTTETLQFMLLPMVKTKRDPIGSMGNDAALACLSDQPRLIYDYFHQLFAQVTNPPIDSIREEVIMSLECFIGPEGNLLDTTEAHCHRLAIPEPILTPTEMAAIRSLNYRGWRSCVLDATFGIEEGHAGLRRALERLCREAEEAIERGDSLVVISDRAVSANRVAVSALLAVGAIHQHLVRVEKRTRIGLVVETGEAREVHHHCLLVGYGADAIHPYLAFDSLRQARQEGHLEAAYTDEKLIAAYRKSVAKGMLKVLAKMGISTLQSYKGAQIFEAVGLDTDPVMMCFEGTASRIRGVGFDVLAEETLQRHRRGFPERETVELPVLPNTGVYHWRRDGEKHAWNPHTIAEIQQAARAGDKGAYRRFSQLVNEQTTRDCNLRGLLDFKPSQSIPLEEVESAAEIVKRFCTGAMSYGSISLEAHQTLAVAMNRLGGKSNTGEGGEDYRRFEPLPNGDSRRSAIKQVASGRFGVTSWYLTNADELQIKMAQGAKPGEGGELPGHKVDRVIAATRMSTPGVGLISPPPHHDIYSIEDLAQLIFDLKNANPRARVSVKLVSEVGVGTIAAGVAKGHADNILISGMDGGTGASPLTSIKHAGLPWELGLAEAHQTLVMNDLRSRVRVQTDGQLKTGRDVVIAALLGAEEFGFATAPLIALGCIMMRKCHLNTCPVGIATQDPELRKKFTGQPEHVINYLFMVAEEAREIMAQLGFRTINEMIGRVDVLKMRGDVGHWKARGLDLTLLLTPAQKPYPEAGVYCTRSQDHGLEHTLDQKLISRCADAIEHGNPMRLEVRIGNTDRTFGTTISHEISRRHGAVGLPDDTLHLDCKGWAGQSFGAWLASGVTLEVEGDANDYVGKGLSGGRIIVYPPRNAAYVPEENIIVGNVALYGATSGEAFFRGIAAERFCVRNSGAETVVEGVGDHGLEYMTGGCAVVLGPTGRNFAAGMSGGFAFVYDPHEQLLAHTNLETVELEAVVEPADIAKLHGLLEKHHRFTGSTVAGQILSAWEDELPKFRKVMPIDYKRALQEMAAKAEAAAV